ncbi:MAG TPA: hypothetical protein VFZ25_06775 [Chloroflexota bacterium]|nr:hypothetical protein [Chloroflexota bacterium]
MWTVPIPAESIKVDLQNGTASMHVVDLPMPDYGAIPNGLTHGKSTPSVVSFDINWQGIVGRSRIADPSGNRAANLLNTGATIAWSAKQEGFHFVSDPASTSRVTDYASIGHERNGVFASGAATEWPPLAVNGQSSTDGKTVTFTYTLANLSTTDLSGPELRIRIPTGSDLVESWFFQRGSYPGTNNGFDVTWATPVGTIPAGGTVGPFTVKTTIPSGKSASQTQSLGWARFLGPTAGDAISGWIAGA